MRLGMGVKVSSDCLRDNSESFDVLIQVSRYHHRLQSLTRNLRRHPHYHHILSSILEHIVSTDFLLFHFWRQMKSLKHENAEWL